MASFDSGINPVFGDPAMKETNWEIASSKEVYMPMLSYSELSGSDLKLHEQWIIRRKRIVYFLTMLTVAAVCFCAVSVIYVLPQMYGENEVAAEGDKMAEFNLGKEDGFEIELPQERPDASFDTEMSPEGSKGFPTLQDEDLHSMTEPSDAEGNEDYTYCVLSEHEGYRKLTNSCNAIIFTEIEDSNLRDHIPTEGFNVSNIIYVRISSPLSENFVQDITKTFPNIQRLTVSIDKLCYGSEVKDRNNLPQVSLLELEKLEIVNATLCPLASWLLNKWNMPSIEKISMTHADVSPTTFVSLKEFIQKRNETLTSVLFIDCFFGDCDIDELPLYHNLTITQTKLRKTSVL